MEVVFDFLPCHLQLSFFSAEGEDVMVWVYVSLRSTFEVLLSLAFLGRIYAALFCSALCLNTIMNGNLCCVDHL